MKSVEDPFEVPAREEREAPSIEWRSPLAALPAAPGVAGALTATFAGFDLDDRPVLTNIPGLPGEKVVARTVVPLVRGQIGSTVVVVCEGADARRPIVLGVLQPALAVDRPATKAGSTKPAPLVSVQADDDRMELRAEREIVLRCGDASITLTRAGKVLIEGKYVLSRSSGYNKIKGAVVDIN